MRGALRFGVGAAVPPRQYLRFTAELFGEKYFDNSINAEPKSVNSSDGSVLRNVITGRSASCDSTAQ